MRVVSPSVIHKEIAAVAKKRPVPPEMFPEFLEEVWEQVSLCKKVSLSKLDVVSQHREAMKEKIWEQRVDSMQRSLQSLEEKLSETQKKLELKIAHIEELELLNRNERVKE